MIRLLTSRRCPRSRSIRRYARSHRGCITCAYNARNSRGRRPLPNYCRALYLPALKRPGDSAAASCGRRGGTGAERACYFCRSFSWIGGDRLINAAGEKWARVDDRTMVRVGLRDTSTTMRSKVAEPALARHNFVPVVVMSSREALNFTRPRVERQDIAMTMARREDNFTFSPRDKCHVKHFTGGFETFH